MFLSTPAYTGPLKYVRHLIVDAEGRGEFLTPGAAMTYLNGVTRNLSNYWQVECRPGSYQTESLIAIPSYVHVFSPFPMDPSRNYEFGSIPFWRPPASGSMSGAFITLGDHSRMTGVVADIFVNVTPGGTLSLLRTTGQVVVHNCRFTTWCSAASQIVSCAEILAGSTFYAAGTLFAIQSATGADRTNARAIWAKGAFSINADCRIHDDDQAGGTGIYYDTALESTMRHCSFGTHPKSQFTWDLNMAHATGVIWFDGTKYWNVTGTVANAKNRENEV